MKLGTLRLCFPVIAMTAQQSAASLLIPPYLDDLKYPVSAIGSLISLGPIFALSARLPSGLFYKGERARILLMAALTVETLCTLLYGLAVNPLQFALVHGLNGFAHGAAGTIYLAYFVDALPPDEDRRHAMGYYAGSLAIGYSAGGFAAGYMGDIVGYTTSFAFASVLGILCLSLLFFLRRPPAHPRPADTLRASKGSALLESLRSLLHPRMATVFVVALFLNLLHQMGNTFLPLYGLTVGLTLTEVGVIKGLYALCNAITRPLSGLVAKRLVGRNISVLSLPLQSGFLTLVPLFHDFGPVLALFLLGGLMRAVAIVGNTIRMVEGAEESRLSRGVASGVFNAAGDLGNVLGPSAGGLIASFTGVAYLFFIGPFMIVVLFFFSLWSCRFIR